jgi:hypothetical protein
MTATIVWQHQSLPSCSRASARDGSQEPTCRATRPDHAPREAIDGATEKLRADGRVTKIYARYGVAFQPPK